MFWKADYDRCGNWSTLVPLPFYYKWKADAYWVGRLYTIHKGRKLGYNRKKTKSKVTKQLIVVNE